MFQFVLERGLLTFKANTPAPELAVVNPPPRKGNCNLFPMCFVLLIPDYVIHFPANVLHLTALLRFLQVFIFLPAGKEANSFILPHWPRPRKALASGLKVERNGNLHHCYDRNGGNSNSWRTRPHGFRCSSCHREKATVICSPKMCLAVYYGFHIHSFFCLTAWK